MEGTPREDRIYYRCAARTLVPGSPLLASHPKNVYLPERAVLDALNTWMGMTFAPENRDHTVSELLRSVGASTTESGKAVQAKKRAAEARTKLRRLQEAITAGANPVALVDAINGAQAELDAAEAEQARTPDAKTISRAEVYALIDYHGDVGAALKREDPAELQRLYEALDLELIYRQEAKVIEGTIRPGRDSERVRGRSCTLFTRISV